MEENIGLDIEKLENVSGGAGASGKTTFYKDLESLENAPFFEKLLSQLAFMKNRGYSKSEVMKSLTQYIKDSEGVNVADQAVIDLVEKYW